MLQDYLDILELIIRLGICSFVIAFIINYFTCEQPENRLRYTIRESIIATMIVVILFGTILVALVSGLL